MRIGMTMAMPVVGQRFPLPTQVDPGNLVLWLRADQGVTLSSMTVNALTAWALTLLTRTAAQSDPDGGTGAVQLTDTVDGAPSIHQAAATITNGQPGPEIDTIWVKAGTIGIFAIQVGASGNSAYYTAATQTFSNITGNLTCSVLQVSGSWHQLRIRNTDTGAGVNPALIVYASKAAGSVTYQGDGLGTFSLYQPEVTQERVSAWADQSGNGNNATQATAGNQPLVKCYDAAGNWVPYGQGSGYEIGWPLDASKFLQFAAGVASSFVGNGVPMTVLQMCKFLGTPAAQPIDCFYLSSPGAGVQAMSLTPAGKLISVHTDDGAVTKTMTSTASYPQNAYGSFTFKYDGTLGTHYLNCVADAGSPANLDVGTETPPNAYTHTQLTMRRELAVYRAALSDTARKRVENGMRVRAGLAPL